MTRLEALRALYDAVKAGRDLGWLVTDETFHIGLIVDAAKGSFDAALAFIAATLPGCHWYRRPDGTMCVTVPNRITIFTSDHEDPATALLLAGLAALIAEEEGK